MAALKSPSHWRSEAPESNANNFSPLSFGYAVLENIAVVHLYPALRPRHAPANIRDAEMSSDVKIPHSSWIDGFARDYKEQYLKRVNGIV